jgi:hypothetical protein
VSAAVPRPAPTPTRAAWTTGAWLVGGSCSWLALTHTHTHDSKLLSTAFGGWWLEWQVAGGRCATRTTTTTTTTTHCTHHTQTQTPDPPPARPPQRPAGNAMQYITSRSWPARTARAAKNRRGVHFLDVPHINNRPLKTGLSYAK